MDVKESKNGLLDFWAVEGKISHKDQNKSAKKVIKNPCLGGRNAL